VTRVLSVLIVDDSAVTRAVIRHAIRACGLDIDVMFEAANGALALTLLETLRVDIVITDLNMPVLDGIQLLGEIVAREWTHITPIVVSTEALSRAEELAALGVEIVIAKPFRPDTIRAALEKVIRRSCST
jgi:CheY-like chemotaxis protein